MEIGWFLKQCYHFGTESYTDVITMSQRGKSPISKEIKRIRDSILLLNFLVALMKVSWTIVEQKLPAAGGWEWRPDTPLSRLLHPPLLAPHPLPSRVHHAQPRSRPPVLSYPCETELNVRGVNKEQCNMCHDIFTSHYFLEQGINLVKVK